MALVEDAVVIFGKNIDIASDLTMGSNYRPRTYKELVFVIVNW